MLFKNGLLGYKLPWTNSTRPLFVCEALVGNDINERRGVEKLGKDCFEPSNSERDA